VDEYGLIHIDMSKCGGGKPKLDSAIPYLVGVYQCLLKPDFNDTQRGSLATGFNDLEDWRKVAAEKHNTL